MTPNTIDTELTADNDEMWSLQELDEREAPLLKTLYEKAQVAAVLFLVGS